MAAILDFEVSIGRYNAYSPFTLEVRTDVLNLHHIQLNVFHLILERQVGFANC